MNVNAHSSTVQFNETAKYTSIVNKLYYIIANKRTYIDVIMYVLNMGAVYVFTISSYLIPFTLYSIQFYLQLYAYVRWSFCQCLFNRANTKDKTKHFTQRNTVSQFKWNCIACKIHSFLCVNERLWCDMKCIFFSFRLIARISQVFDWNWICYIIENATVPGATISTWKCISK